MNYSWQRNRTATFEETNLRTSKHVQTNKKQKNTIKQENTKQLEAERVRMWAGDFNHLKVIGRRGSNKGYNVVGTSNQVRCGGGRHSGEDLYVDLLHHG